MTGNRRLFVLRLLILIALNLVIIALAAYIHALQQRVAPFGAPAASFAYSPSASERILPASASNSENAVSADAARL